MSLQPNPGIAPAPQKKGCLFYGCMTAIVVTVVIFIGIFIGFRYMMSSFVDQYTQTTAAQLPQLDNSTESYLKVKEKVEAFQAIARQNQPAKIELTAAEVNTYLASHPGLEGVSDHFRVTIDGSELKGILSVALDKMGYPDRFFNGNVSLNIKLINKKLQVHLSGLQVGGTTMPEAVLQQLGAEDIFEQLQPEAKQKAEEILAGVTSISVENGLLKMQSGENQG